MEKTEYGLDWAFAKRFLRMHVIYLYPKLLSFSSLLLVSLLLAKMAEEALGYRVGLLSSDFDLVLVSRDFEGYLRTLIKSLLLVTLMSLLKASRQYLQKWLTLVWRRQLTVGLQTLYFDHSRFYALNCVNNEKVDNGDQRMTADVELLTSTYGQIVAEIVVAPFTVAYYFYDSYTRAGWQGPALAVFVFLVFTVVNRLIMAPIVRAVAAKERAEGDFRFTHVDTRCNSESVAFGEGGRVYRQRTEQQLECLLRAQSRLYRLQFLLDTSVIFFGYIMVNASFVLIAVPIFDGSYDHLDDAQLASYISANAFVTISLVYQLTKLVQQSEEMSSLAGVTSRIMELEQLLLSMERCEPNNCSLPNEVYLKLSNLSVSTPKGRVLVRNLSMEQSLGSNLLISGPSSAGKSSLLRVIKGLWQPDSGHFVLNKEIEIMFLSQKIHLCEGLTLREQLAFPQDCSSFVVDEPQLIVELEQFDLLNIYQTLGMDTPYSGWNSSLSPGEIQRLALLRVLLHRPKVAVLDEATANLSLDTEHRLLTLLGLAQITLLSVGHRQSLEQFHHRVLSITGNGQWVLREPLQNQKSS